MDIFTLDPRFRRENVIDVYNSFIWTERYSAMGDFKLMVNANQGYEEILAPGTPIAIPGSRRVMFVETIDDSIDEEGVNVLDVTGYSLESFLSQRIASSGLNGNPWTITDTPGGICRYIFNQICVNGLISIYDKLPYYVTGSLYPTSGTIPEPAETITMQFDPDTVYTVIKKICDMYNLGFRMYRGPDDSKLYFNVYTGYDRTSGQQLRPVVLFSPESDTMSGVSQIQSTAEYKNVAYVTAPNGSLMVYSASALPTTAGFSRRVMRVDADDIDLPAGTDLTEALRRRGQEALAEQKVVISFDGEITQNSGLVYDRDYRLGDLVETRRGGDIASNMRVTEQIFVSDAEGDRSYPSLSVDQVITPGTWFSWDNNQVWDDVVGQWDEV